MEISDARCLLVAEGHATGSERVCAAISGIIYALAGFLANERAEVDEMQVPVLGDGMARLSCEGSERVCAAYQMAAIGLAQIAKEHPNFIEVYIF